MTEKTEDLRLHEARLAEVWLRACAEDSLVGTLDALYQHEINVGMQAFWDDGWNVWIGDEMNGHHAERHFDRDEIKLVAGWLRKAAEDLYPPLKYVRLRSGVDG